MGKVIKFRRKPQRAKQERSGCPECGYKLPIPMIMTAGLLLPIVLHCQCPDCLQEFLWTIEAP